MLSVEADVVQPDEPHVHRGVRFSRVDLHVAVLVLFPVNGAVAALTALGERLLEHLPVAPIAGGGDLITRLLRVFADRTGPASDERGQPPQRFVMPGEHVI